MDHSITSIPRLTAVEGLLVSCLEDVRRLARKYASMLRGLEVDDLVSAGCVAMVEASARVTLSRPERCGYLLRAARNGMVDYIIAETPYVFLRRLEAPARGDGSGRALIDCLADTGLPEVSGRDFEALYEALDRLSPVKRRAICGYYGLDGIGQSPLREIAMREGVPVNTVRSRVRRAVEALREDRGLGEACCDTAGCKREATAYDDGRHEFTCPEHGPVRSGAAEGEAGR